MTSELDPPGLAILDSGCTKTMHGATWAKRYEAELEKLGLTWQEKEKKQLFKGVGGNVQSNVVKVYPIALSKVHGEMCSSEAPGPLPLLLSWPFMEELGTVIDLGKQVVSFTALGVRNLALKKTARGHLAVNILDFDPENLAQDYSPTSEDLALAAGTFVPKALPSRETPRELTPSEVDEILAGYSQDYPEVPEGMNPDDFSDYQAHLEMMRQDVANWEAEQRQGQGHHHDEDVSEDVHYFEQAVAADPRPKEGHQPKVQEARGYGRRGRRRGLSFPPRSFREDPGHKAATRRQDVGEATPFGLPGSEPPLCDGRHDHRRPSRLRDFRMEGAHFRRQAPPSTRPPC